ncbi:integral membrane protein [Rutstroemia sp. NJR-2017a BBW]|nr:integral membrane protein [Rutstroemia sp. NJR-2017a BBW]
MTSAGIATMIRIPFIKKLPITDNFLYATTDVAILCQWSTIEPGLGIIAFSIITLRPLLRSFFPNTFDSISAADRLSFGEDQPHDDFISELPTYMYNYNYVMNTRHTRDSRASTFTSYTSTTYDSIRMMKDRKIRSTVTSIAFNPPQEYEEFTNPRNPHSDTISIQSTTIRPLDEIDYDDSGFLETSVVCFEFSEKSYCDGESAVFQESGCFAEEFGV